MRVTEDVFRWVDIMAGAVGLTWSLAVIAGFARSAGSEASPDAAAAVTRTILISLHAMPWLLAAWGFLAGLRSSRFGAMAPLMAGTGGLLVSILVPVRILPSAPILILIAGVLARILYNSRTPAHPMAYLGIFAMGFVLTTLGYIVIFSLILTAPPAG